MITKHPAPQKFLKPGKTTTFIITATSYQLSYQWRKDGVHISGANSFTYTIQSVTESNEGQYSCVVSNDAGSVTSTSASLTVCKCFSNSITIMY